MSDARKIIDYAMDDDAKEVREALYASIYDRVTSAFEEKRMEIAGSLLGMPLSTEETEVEVDEDEEFIDEELHEATSAYHAHGFTDKDEKQSHAEKVKREHNVKVTWHSNKAGGSEALRYHGNPQDVKNASHDLNDKGPMREEDESEDKAMCKDAAKKEVKGHEKRMHKKED